MLKYPNQQRQTNDERKSKIGTTKLLKNRMRKNANDRLGTHSEKKLKRFRTSYYYWQSRNNVSKEDDTEHNVLP